MESYLLPRFIFTIFLVGLNVGIFLVLAKLRAIEYYSLHKRKWMPSCNFCLFFWMAFIEVVRFITADIIFTWAGFIWTIQLALFAAAISRKLL